MQTDKTTKILLGAVLAILVIILITLLTTKQKDIDPIIVDDTSLEAGEDEPTGIIPSQQPKAPVKAASTPQTQGNPSPNQADGVTTSYSGTFTGPNGEYSFKIPSGWKALQASQSSTVYFGPYVTPEIADGTMVISRNQVSATAFMQSLTDNFDFTFTEQYARTINGNSAVSALMKTEGGSSGPFMAIYKNGTVYTFSLTLDDPIMFESLVSTFKVN